MPRMIDNTNALPSKEKNPQGLLTQIVEGPPFDPELH